MADTFYISTPIFYANSLPHLGHLYTTIVADAVRRYKRQRGFDTFFLTGTDEHGINIQRAAEKNKRTPREQVDYISGELKRMFRSFRLDAENGGYDIFMRTTERFHYEGVSHLWREIAKNKTPKGNDPIYKGFYKGLFCAPCAEFKTEDQYYIPESSDIPHCFIHERPLDKVAEESYFFRLSDYGEFLIDRIEGDPHLVRPEGRRNEVLSFVRGGLQDLSISRQKSSVSWGIPVPGDENHVMYVWMDALTNYITALGYGSGQSETASGHLGKYWPAVHLVGKDILRFHSVYWFSFLHAAGLPLPKTVFAHGMWLDAEGRKMGKTMGNVIEVDVLHEHFQVDTLRYFLLREMVFGQDGKFGYENLIDRANADLASGLGNLASRTFSMITKYRDGLIPSGKIAEKNYLEAKRAGVSPDDQEIVSVVEHARDEFIRRFDNFEFSLALETVWTVIARVDKLISDSKPWELIKEEKQSETLNAVLYRACETLQWLCIQLYPVMPEASKNIYSQIGLSGDIATIDPANLKWGGLAAGTRIGETVGVFPRIDKNKVMNKISEQKAVSGQQSAPDASSGDESVSSPTVREGSASNSESIAVDGGGSVSSPTVREGSASNSESIDVVDGGNLSSPTVREGSTQTSDSYITIDDFLKVELRVGEIKVAERIPNADKLLRFEIDLGESKPRQILAGLAEYYDPEKLLGRKVVVVANLKPRKMRGLLSEGMICAASLEDESGPSPALAAFLEDVKVGARLK